MNARMLRRRSSAQCVFFRWNLVAKGHAKEGWRTLTRTINSCSCTIRGVSIVIAVTMHLILAAEIPIIELKDIAMQPGYECYDPAIGALYKKSNFIANLYTYGQQEHALVKLAHEFFVYSPDGGFRATSSHARITNYLTPHDLGRIIGAIAVYEREIGTATAESTAGSAGSAEAAAAETASSRTGHTSTARDNLTASIKKCIDERIQGSTEYINDGILHGISETIVRNKQFRERTLEKIYEFVNTWSPKAELKADALAIVEEFRKAARASGQKLAENVERLAVRSDQWETLKDLLRSDSDALAAYNDLKHYDESLVRDAGELRRIKEPKQKKTASGKELARLLRKKEEALRRRKEAREGGEKAAKEAPERHEVAKELVIKYEPLQKSTRTLPGLIADSLDEERRGLYPQTTTVNVLLGWLWGKFSSRNDCIVYLEGLAEGLGLKSPDTIVLLVPRRYGKDDYFALTGGLQEKEIERLSLAEYVLARYGYDLYANSLPPDFEYEKSTYRCIAMGKNESVQFPDCVETAIRKFFNAILYNPNTRRFDTHILGKLGATGPLMDFYQGTYGDVETYNSQEARNAWATVVSGLEGVAYREDACPCNIQSSIKNILAVMKKLLPGANTSSVEAFIQSLDDLGADIRASSVPPEEEDFGNIELVLRRGGKENLLKIDVDNYHTALVYPRPENATHFESYRRVLANRIASITRDVQPTAAHRCLSMPIMIAYTAFVPSSNDIFDLTKQLLREGAAKILENFLLLISLRPPQDRLALAEATASFATEASGTDDENAALRIVDAISGSFCEDNAGVEAISRAVLAPAEARGATQLSRAFTTGFVEGLKSKIARKHNGCAKAEKFCILANIALNSDAKDNLCDRALTIDEEAVETFSSYFKVADKTELLKIPFDTLMMFCSAAGKIQKLSKNALDGVRIALGIAEDKSSAERNSALRALMPLRDLGILALLKDKVKGLSQILLNDDMMEHMTPQLLTRPIHTTQEAAYMQTIYAAIKSYFDGERELLLSGQHLYFPMDIIIKRALWVATLFPEPATLAPLEQEFQQHVLEMLSLVSRDLITLCAQKYPNSMDTVFSGLVQARSATTEQARSFVKSLITHALFELESVKSHEEFTEIATMVLTQANPEKLPELSTKIYEKFVRTIPNNAQEIGRYVSFLRILVNVSVKLGLYEPLHEYAEKLAHPILQGDPSATTIWNALELLTEPYTKGQNDDIKERIFNAMKPTYDALLTKAATPTTAGGLYAIMSVYARYITMPNYKPAHIRFREICAVIADTVAVTTFGGTHDEVIASKKQKFREDFLKKIFKSR